MSRGSVKSGLTFLIVAVFGIVFFVFVLKNLVVNSIIAGALKSVTGMPVKIGATDASFSQGRISIKNLLISNPSAFGGKAFLDAPEITLDIVPDEIFQKRIHLEELTLNIQELVIVKGKNGQMNIDRFKPAKSSSSQGQTKSSETKDSAKDSTKASNGYQLLIDKLSLSIGKVSYIDQTVNPPKTMNFDLNIKNREFRHINNLQTVASAILLEVLSRTPLASIANINVSDLTGNVADVLKDGAGLGKEGVKRLEKQAKDILKLLN